MHCGVVMFATDYAIRVDELARAAEERGYESLWLPEHTHVPISRLSPWPGGPVLPREYWHTYDLFVALAMAAATTRLRIASGICLLVERDPIITAKQVASLEYCDGWMPIIARAGDLAADMAQLRRVAEEKGRDPATLSVSVYGAPMDADALAQLRDLSVDRAILALPSASRDEVLPLLDRGAGLIPAVA